MKFTKVFFSVLAFAFFLFNGTADAQLNVAATGEVSIGTNSTIAKLRVYNTTETYTNYLSNQNSTNSTKYGIYNYVSSAGTGTRYGLYQTSYSNSGSAAQNRGIYSYVYNSGSGNAYGLYANVSTVGTGTKYGVYSTIGSGTGYAGYFIGDVVVDGSFQIMLMSPGQTSKMAPIANVTNKIKGLNTIATANKKNETTYAFDEASFRAAFPELVKATPRPADEMVADEEGAKPVMTSKETTVATIDYSSLLPVLVEALKEQQVQIEMLENQIKEIKANH